MTRKKPRDVPPFKANDLDQLWWIGGKNTVVWVWDSKVGWLEMNGRPWSNIEICVVVPNQPRHRSRGVTLNWGTRSGVPEVINQAIAARDAKYERTLKKPEAKIIAAKDAMPKSDTLLKARKKGRGR